MNHIKIVRYFRGSSSEHKFAFLSNCAEGPEDHFDRAYNDAQMFMRGMQEADKITNWGHDKPPRYTLVSLVTE